MNNFDPLASAQAALFSLFSFGHLGFAAQFFVEPHTAAPSEKPDPSPTSIAAIAEAAPLARSSPLVAPSLEPRSPPAKNSPQWLSNRFVHRGQTHRFKLYIPSVRHRQPLPMIVMLHGAQQDPDDLAAGTEMNEAAEACGFIVAYPEQSESTNLLRCWHWFRASDQARESGETAMIAALTREVVAAYNVDCTRIYVAGMSAGYAMAVNLAVTHPDLYAAAAVHSGVSFGVADEAFSALCAMNDGMGKIRLPAHSADDFRLRAVPLIVFHGDADETVHPRNSDQIVAMRALMSGDCGAAPEASSTYAAETENAYAYTCHVFHDENGSPVGEQWLVHGLGHAWSGGNSRGTYTDSRGPHATSEMIRFFNQFALGTLAPLDVSDRNGCGKVDGPMCSRPRHGRADCADCTG
ncbi:PHB depolymerase family esterase [Caballeronia pedi]|uniref:PHB depolymerase family esterase n=1 Tax=Caballeronia pedi TaxID=1777141 RepID=A0A158DZ44_9BURK|nr:PHB depolymerase family esterase [Caballeronia pedi]SAK99848.1 PHB depolymerase family esterase [Caballeronia pedi]